MDKDRPVHASRARRCATIQSTEPLRFTTANEVVGDRTETRAVTGLAEETCIVLSNCLVQSTGSKCFIPSDRGKAHPEGPCGRVRGRSTSKPPIAITNCQRIIQSYITHHSELHTLSALPLSPTNVPRRVYRFCEAESDTERSEYGAPMTSKRASINHNCQLST